MSSMAEPVSVKAFFFDISALLEYVGQYERYSGIQRVVATLIARFAALPDVGPVYLSFVDPARGENLCVPFEQVGVEVLEAPSRMRATFFFNAARQAPLIDALERYRRHPLKYRFHKHRLDLMFALGRERPFRRFGVSRELWPQLCAGAAPDAAPAPISPQPFASVAQAGDKLILLDSSWLDRHTDAFARAKQLGVEIYPFAHDLIPLVAAASIEKGEVSKVFYDWLIRSAAYATRFLANSRATASDLAAFLSAHGRQAPVVAVPLAQAGLESIDDSGQNFRPRAGLGSIGDRLYPVAAEALDLSGNVRVMALSPYVLCVGTIEARKNIWRLLMAWKSLIDRGHYDLPKLALAGRKGWLSRDVEDFLSGTGHLTGYVQLIETPSDEELAFLYRHCAFGAMVSLYEGWGLPVGEALAYGKTSVAARAGALPEVGGDLVEYCDPLSVTSIADAVWRLWSEPGRREALEARIAATRLRGWDDVARDLLDAVRD